VDRETRSNTSLDNSGGVCGPEGLEEEVRYMVAHLNVSVAARQQPVFLEYPCSSLCSSLVTMVWGGSC
jgi:hypothetical protein